MRNPFTLSLEVSHVQQQNCDVSPLKEQMKLQFRFDGYNFLNHPLYSFIGGSANLKPTFDVTGKQTNSLFGVTTEKQGHRIIQLAVKFYF